MADRNPSSSDSEWSPPETFEEYRLLCPLSRGGMGEVYLGHDTLLDRPVAIKFIRALGVDDSAAYIREQILNEARAAARLQHPNVVTIYRVSEIDGHPMIISEFVRGQNLDDAKKPIPWQRVLEIGMGIARGLAAAHRRGVLHLDIKPGNVIVQHDGEVKLLDFGLAKLLDLGLGLSAVEVGEEAMKGNAHRTPQALATTMELSLESAAKLMTSTPLANLARGVAADEGVLSESQREKSVSVSAGVMPRITPLLGHVAQPKPSSAQIGSSSDAVPAVGGSSASGAVTSELPRLNLTPPGHTNPRVGASSFVGVDWELPKSSVANRIAGTPLYMAPETWRGEPGTRRADIYSTGALLFELCTGVPPFQNVSLQELPQVVNQRDAPALYSLAPNVDPRLAAVIDRCLKRDPAQRYGSGDELREALEQLRPNQRNEELPEGNPYRGLLAFEAEHRSLFFGRKSEIGTILERLRTDPFVLVVADSGIGKSSLCRAGVLPHVKEGALGGGRTWQARSMLPGKHPLQALCAEFSEVLGIGEAELMARLRHDPSSLGRVLHKHLSSDRGVILFIDQLEEIVTIGDPEEALVTAATLGHLCARIHGVRMLMTVRSDFLARVAALQGLGDELSRGLYLLRPLSPDKIHEAIVGPAAQKGVHFESDEMVEALAVETAQTDGGLPLLQFALTELWEARKGDSITKASLDAIGGVSGALARHADQVMLGLPDDQRKEAKRLLMALVTLEGTRARRSQEELVRSEAARIALESLVKARLLVARDTGEGVSYEVAHEALLKGWSALRRWLDEHQESRAARTRLEQATAEWLRLNKSRDALWGPQQLAETELLESADIGGKETNFLDASRRAMQRKRQLRNALALLVPVLAVLMYTGYELKQRRDLRMRVDSHVGEAIALFKKGQQLSSQVEALRKQSFAAFDSRQPDDGEKKWALVLDKSVDVDELFSRASQSLEAALTLDGSRGDVKTELAAVLFERAQVAERDNNPAKLRDLLARLSLYDLSGTQMRAWNTPARLTVASNPPGARVSIARYVENKKKRFVLVEERELGTAPLPRTELPPGSYLLTLRLASNAEVRYPVLLHRGEQLPITIDLLPEDRIPKGFVYIPAGRFLFGSAGDETVRKGILSAAPQHEIHTDGYLIARYELTYGEWIEHLRALAPAERQQQMIRGADTNGGVDLQEVEPGIWQLTLKPGEQAHTAKSNERLVYSGRKIRATQDWSRLPVTGMSQLMATRYATWLAQSGRVAGARICTEYEWERAARGADERDFPHGNTVDVDEANYDETYDRQPANIGPDEVGSYPASMSPFGLQDMIGNAGEWVLPMMDKAEVLSRGGGFFVLSTFGRSNWRCRLATTFREPMVGVRICANLPR